jgi:hypothetical protein
MNLAPQQFTNKVSKVHSAFLYMKAGRASLYADWVPWFKAKIGVLQYLLWFAFWEDFAKTFCPKSKAQRALTQVMQPFSRQNWCPLCTQPQSSGPHRHFWLPHHGLHLCCCHCHLHPISWLWSQWTGHLQTCYQCTQSGHLCHDCTLCHNTCYITLEEKEDLIQQLMADIDAATGQQPEQGPRAMETSVEAAVEVSAEEDFVPHSR